MRGAWRYRICRGGGLGFRFRVSGVSGVSGLGFIGFRFRVWVLGFRFSGFVFT